MRGLVLAALLYSAAMRLFELTRSRRSGARLKERGARLVEKDGMGLIAAVHTLWFLGIVVEEVFFGPTFTSPLLQGAFAVVFLLAEATRLWCMATLGERWNVRVWVLDDAPLVRTGPYRGLRHPNYLAAAIALAALPLALGLVWTSAILVVPKLLAVRRRIRIEDAALAWSLPGRGAPSPRSS